MSQTVFRDYIFNQSSMQTVQVCFFKFNTLLLYPHNTAKIHHFIKSKHKEQKTLLYLINPVNNFCIAILLQKKKICVANNIV